MARTIAINGTKLDEVRMLMEPDGSGSVVYLSYPKSELRLSGNDQTLHLVIPAYLALELYRLGVLPQDLNLPMEVSISGRAVGWFTVSDVRYPHHHEDHFPVKFTLTPVVQDNPRPEPVASLPRHAGSGTYVTDITHYLDETSELMPLPGPARKLASFLVLIIEAATSAEVGDDHATGIRCRKKSCQGTIRTLLLPDDHEISWRCPVCEHHGVIRNWQNTKWNQLKGTEESR